MRAILSLCVGAVLLAAPLRAAEVEPLAGLVTVLKESNDTALQLDILRGISSAVKGRRTVAMPAGWEVVETKLTASKNSEIQSLTQGLGLTFGSQKALAALRATALDANAELGARRAAVQSLLSVKDAQLPGILLKLLGAADLRPEALRGLAAYDDAASAPAIMAVYGQLSNAEKRDALNTLTSRVPFAKALLAAIDDKKVPAKDLTAEVVRQLRSLKNPEFDAQITKFYGVFKDTSADKVAEIEKYTRVYRAGGSTPGDASRGRLVFSKACQQCHTLFDAGGNVGPDLTGSNRSDLAYILQNMVDPNAVIPNDYRSSTIETKDERVITGIVKQQDEKALTIATANEQIILPRNEVKTVFNSEISMMPEGLLAQLSDQEIRDLIYYLSRPGQAPMPGGK